ncbi:hypothetical protein ACJMK2_010379 [Sinanodonta woodiana]|uniref:Uncharacterized protein n=1 Tax=Sinanodonta woodiana TaxID=1069815 RepID=A0ABD3VF56_SINWO
MARWIIVVFIVQVLLGITEAAECACAINDTPIHTSYRTPSYSQYILTTGDCASFHGHEVKEEELTWLQITYNGQIGWVIKDHVKLSACKRASPFHDQACTGGHKYSATGTAYYPSNDPIEGGFVDMRGHPLHTLQAYLAGHAPFVSVAMDNHAGIAYGTHVCIPEMNHKYHKVIDFQVVDTGSAFTGKGHSRIDICVATRSDSYDNTINAHLTLVFQ